MVHPRGPRAGRNKKIRHVGIHDDKLPHCPVTTPEKDHRVQGKCGHRSALVIDEPESTGIPDLLSKSTGKYITSLPDMEEIMIINGEEEAEPESLTSS